MADERLANDATALDEATDRVIREMTQAAVSDDAVTRVMARVRAARGAAVDSPAVGIAAGLGTTSEPSTRNWLAALLEPRVSWPTAAAAAAVAAIIAASVTALVLRTDRNAPAPLIAAATPSMAPDARATSALAPAEHPPAATNGSGGTSAPLQSQAASAGTTATPAATSAAATASGVNARGTNALAPANPSTATNGSGGTSVPPPSQAASAGMTATRAANDAAATASGARTPGAGQVVPPPDQAASGVASATRAASDAAATVPPVAHPRRGRVKEANGVGSTVTATMVAAPDEEQPRAQDGARATPQDVRLDVTINDQSGSGKPVAKTVSMVVADRESGSIKSQTRMPFRQAVRAADPNAPPPAEAWSTETLPLNVDAWPTILPDGRVRVKLVLSYRTASPPAASASGPLATASVEKNLITVLTDGKPLVVSESADAATDRKVTVEVKATIQK